MANRKYALLIFAGRKEKRDHEIMMYQLNDLYAFPILLVIAQFQAYFICILQLFYSILTFIT